MTFRHSLRFITLLFPIILLASCASTEPRVSERGFATLHDEPRITFHTSGWSYTNTTNPFLLTPDYLTNAMEGISRFKVGDSLLQNGPVVSEPINKEAIRELLNERKKSEDDLVITDKQIGSHDVVVAEYSDEEKIRKEYALELNGFLLHILVVANHGNYSSSAEAVVQRIIETVAVP